MKGGVPVRVIQLPGSGGDAVRRLGREFEDVKEVEAVDMRGANPADMARRGLITPAAYVALVEGRKHHYEMPSTGCVGLYLSFKKALEEGEGWVLICEQDCFLKEGARRKVEELVERRGKARREDRFDVAILGPVMLMRPGTECASLPGMSHIEKPNSFWGTHCTLVSPEGRKRLLSLLEAPFETQLDGWLSHISSLREVRVVVESKGSSAGQLGEKNSFLQTDNCTICHLPAEPITRKLFVVVATLMALGAGTLVFLLVRHCLRMKGFKMAAEASMLTAFVAVLTFVVVMS